MRGWKAPVEPFTPGSGPEAVKGLTVGWRPAGMASGSMTKPSMAKLHCISDRYLDYSQINTPIEGYPCVLMRRMIRQKLGTPAAGDS